MEDNYPVDVVDQVFAIQIGADNGYLILFNVFSFFFSTVPLILSVLGILMLRGYLKAYRRVKEEREEQALLGVVAPRPKNLFLKDWTKSSELNDDDKN